MISVSFLCVKMLKMLLFMQSVMLLAEVLGRRGFSYFLVVVEVEVFSLRSLCPACLGSTSQSDKAVGV